MVLSRRWVGFSCTVLATVLVMAQAREPAPDCGRGRDCIGAQPRARAVETARDQVRAPIRVPDHNRWAYDDPRHERGM